MRNTDAADIAALCATCREPLILYPVGTRGRLAWDHPVEPDEDEAALHLPAPLPGSVAPADVWDIDAASAGRLGTYDDEAEEFARV